MATDLPMSEDATPGEIASRIESGIPGASVTDADGDGHHFRVAVIADAFEGLSRIDRHRMVNDVFAGELGGRIHALSISCQTPEEAR